MSDLFAVTIFGVELDWTVSTTVLVLMLVQIALVAVALLAFVFLVVRKHALSNRKQNILVTHAAEDEAKDHAVVGISLDTAVVKRKFLVGEEFDYEGLIVTASYNSEPSAETVKDFSVDAPDMTQPGKPTVTVWYNGYSAYYTIEVAEREAVRSCIGISVDSSAAKKEFTVGEPFDFGGIVVHARYDLEPFSEEVFDFEVEEPSTDTEGEKQVVVRRGDFAEYYHVNVVAARKARELIGIDLDVESVRADFVVGETFDCSGLVVIARYDAEPYSEQVTDFTVEEPDMTKKGMTNVVVHFGDYVQTYPIFIAEGRTLVGITLDTSVVRREFVTGEEFNAVGLIVTAEYDAEPFTEELTDYGLQAPDLTEEGEKEVVVSYLGKMASYTVTVTAPVSAPAEEPAEEPAPETSEEAIAAVPAEEGEEGSEEGSVVRYDKSFTARLIQSSDETKHWYTLLKNDLLSYKKVKDRMSWKKETYRFAKENIAKFGFRGNTLCLFLALTPAEVDESRYKVEDVSANRSFEDTPCMYRIKNDMRVKRAFELIAAVMERVGAEKYDRISEDYYLPYEGIHELVNKGLAKRLIVVSEGFEGMGQNTEGAGEELAAAGTFKKNEQVLTEPFVIEEESVEGGNLRYDKSFHAKVIQADDETKKFYSAIKNELLSYKKVHDRLSWKRETYKAAGGCVAKIGFRGNTLCLFLPLDPAEYAESRYKVEDASANKSSEDTPCMFRIKNDKRLRLSFDLIARVMEERGLVRTDRPEEDYAEPYQDIVQLIEQGLVRRKITTKEEEEAVFSRK